MNEITVLQGDLTLTKPKHVRPWWQRLVVRCTRCGYERFFWFRDAAVLDLWTHHGVHLHEDVEKLKELLERLKEADERWRRSTGGA